MTWVFCSLNNASLNGEVRPEVWLEEAKREDRRKEAGAGDFESFQAFHVRGSREMGL